MEKYKFLYDLSKKALDDELDRYKKLDEKASRFLTILGVCIVAYTALINAAAANIFPLHKSGWGGWLFVILSIISLIALFSSWFRIFTSIRLSDTPRVEIGHVANTLAADYDLVTMYYSLAMSCQEAQKDAARRLMEKTGWLHSAYREIQFSAGTLMASLLTYFLFSLNT